MIIDLQRFINAEKPYWDELARITDRLGDRRRSQMSIEEAKRFHYLYERAASDLARLRTFAARPEAADYLESLVARAYAEIHEGRRRERFNAVRWLSETFPQTFRRHFMAFVIATAVFMSGALFGGVALLIDPDSRYITMAFGHDQLTPSERVSEEESGQRNVAGNEASFAGMLMVNNIRVSILTLASGMTFGILPIVILFYNGIILGAIGVDYIVDGQAVFLMGWLLPHGSIEIPAILFAGQASLVLANALLGTGGQKRFSMEQRLQNIRDDMVTIIAGVAIILVWAGIVESFFSQFHEPAIPYAVKIIFGVVQGAGLFAYLFFAGRPRAAGEANVRESDGAPAAGAATTRA